MSNFRQQYLSKCDCHPHIYDRLKQSASVMGKEAPGIEHANGLARRRTLFSPLRAFSSNILLGVSFQCNEFSGKGCPAIRCHHARNPLGSESLWTEQHKVS